MTRRRGVEFLSSIVVFTVLVAAMTWPQALYLSSHAVQHQDIYFNMWRLRWFAHALATTPSRLFDANIFYPETGTLALSDAMLVQGAAGAPLLWAAVDPVLVHNILLLGAIALSGAAMYALVRYLTGSRGAGLLAGIIFAFAPYRVDHVMHMELQWTMWMPLAFLALHGTLDTGRLKYGLATGACIALQMMSSIYYGIFLVTLIAPACLLLLARDRKVPLARAAGMLAAGAILAVVISAAYAVPYLRVQDRVGERPIDDVVSFSATPASYLTATPGNWVWGRFARPREGAERRLFPGAAAVVLGIVGVLLQTPSRRVIVYLLLLVAAFETSLGFGGYAYTFLHEHVPVYRALRAAARLGIFVVMFVGVLAGFGYRALAAGRPPLVRAAVVAAFAAVMSIEYRATVNLVAYSGSAPAMYRMLARQPRGVLLELPVPPVDRLPGHDPEYAFMSTFHWFPLVNGYSGNYPPSYLARLERLRNFPDNTAILQIRRDNVRYVIVRKLGYSAEAWAELQGRMTTAGLFVELGIFDTAHGQAVLYQVR
jgi:hypothetical protein